MRKNSCQGAIPFIPLIVIAVVLVVIPATVKLVQERQKTSPEATGEICPQAGASCSDTYPESCNNGTGTRICHKSGTCSGVGGGVRCSWGPGSYCENCSSGGPTVPPYATPTPRPQPTATPIPTSSPTCRGSGSYCGAGGNCCPGLECHGYAQVCVPIPTSTPKSQPTATPIPTSSPTLDCPYTGLSVCKIACGTTTCDILNGCYVCPNLIPPTTPIPPTATPKPINTPVPHECSRAEDCAGSGRCNLSCSGWPRKCSWTACPIIPTLPPQTCSNPAANPGSKTCKDNDVYICKSQYGSVFWDIYQDCGPRGCSNGVCNPTLVSTPKPQPTATLIPQTCRDSREYCGDGTPCCPGFSCQGLYCLTASTNPTPTTTSCTYSTQNLCRQACWTSCSYTDGCWNCPENIPIQNPTPTSGTFHGCKNPDAKPGEKTCKDNDVYTCKSFVGLYFWEIYENCLGQGCNKNSCNSPASSPENTCFSPSKCVPKTVGCGMLGKETEDKNCGNPNYTCCGKLTEPPQPSPTPTLALAPTVTLVPTRVSQPTIPYLFTSTQETADLLEVTKQFNAAKNSNITIILVGPNSTAENDKKIYEFLNAHDWVAMTHEDLPITRNYSCAPQCQFWNVEKLTTAGYYDKGTIAAVFNHEAVHNRQATNDPYLAEHVREGPDKFVYQALIEGEAEESGWEVGGQHYTLYRQFHEEVSVWAKNKGLEDLFQNAANGHWGDFQKLKSKYFETEGHSLTELVKYRCDSLAQNQRGEHKNCI